MWNPSLLATPLKSGVFQFLEKLKKILDKLEKRTILIVMDINFNSNPVKGTSMQYLVTKRFTGGTLKGIKITEKTSVKFKVGQVVCQSWLTPSSYVIEEIKKA